jgi:hypothetical protein
VTNVAQLGTRPFRIADVLTTSGDDVRSLRTLIKRAGAAMLPPGGRGHLLPHLHGYPIARPYENPTRNPRRRSTD